MVHKMGKKHLTLANIRRNFIPTLKQFRASRHVKKGG